MIYIILLLLILITISIYYNIKFASYIFAIEDILSATIETHENTIKTFEKIQKIEVFFDDENMKKVFSEAKEDLKFCQFEIQRVANKFLELSKNKYIIEEVEENK
jgi:hypothetical protein